MKRGLIRVAQPHSGKRTSHPDSRTCFELPWWLAAPLLLGSATGALAQADAPNGVQRKQLEEVVVTANRRTESLQEVATSITALSGDRLATQGIVDFEDIKKAAAGIYLEMPSNMSSASLRIRGVGSAGQSGVDPSVGVLVDGVYQVRHGAAFTEMLDIERVEVLRGPQGTLFGKNTTAGVIHIHTRDPDPTEFSGKVQAVAGNYDNRELRGSVNVPLIDDKLALRLSAYTAARDGYTKNIFTGEDTRDEGRHGGRLKLLWNATDDLEVLWASEYLNSEGDLDQGLIRYGRDNITSRLPVSGQPWENLAAALGKTLPPIAPGRAAQNPSEFEDTVERHVLTLNWALPGHTLQSITAYESADSYFLQDRDQTILEISSLISEPETTTRSQELILSSDEDRALAYIFGLFYQEEELGSPTTILNGPDTVALGGSGASTLSTTNRDNVTSAVFTNLTYTINEAWSVVGGARYTKDEKESLSSLDLGSRVIYPQDAKETFDEWTYTGKVRYHFADNAMAYVSVDHGFKSGGFNRQDTSCLFGVASRCIEESRLTYDSETTDSIEIGLKSDFFDNRLRLNGALFYQIYDDYQVAEALPGEAFVLVSNAAKVESKGVEFDLSALLTDQLTLDVALALIDTRYDEFENAPCATATQPGCVGGVQDLSGERLDNAPAVSGNVGLEYRSQLAIAGGLEWFARFDTSFRSEAYLDVARPEESRQGGYALYGARLGVEPLDGQWQVTLWGNNLGDKEYALSRGLSEAGETVYVGTPRTFGVTVDWNF